jgi:hypothetical protein
MKSIRFLLIAVVALLVACDGGSLYNVPSLNNFDFKYMSEFAQPYSALDNGKPLILHSRFIWTGEHGEIMPEEQHAVLAFTQQAASGWKNNYGETLWSHGAGAFVGEQGLEMELWFREDKNGNGFEDDAANAYVWNQREGRCARDVAGELKDGVRCLDDKSNPDGFITSAPDFVLRKGVPYILRIELQPGNNGRMSLTAELYTSSPMGGFDLVQRGLVWFNRADHFPVPQQNLSASVARTPGEVGESVVEFMMFN